MTRKGYSVPDGYMGWIGTRYQLFESEGAYDEYADEVLYSAGSDDSGDHYVGTSTDEHIIF